MTSTDEKGECPTCSKLVRLDSEGLIGPHPDEGWPVRAYRSQCDGVGRLAEGDRAEARGVARDAIAAALREAGAS